MTTKKINLLAILMALQIIISSFYIPVFDNIRIYFTFAIVMLIGIIFDYRIALTYSIVEDLLAFFIFPSGPFFLGYTLTAFASMAIYCLFLNKEVSLLRIILAKASVNLFINVGLGSLWSAMLYSKAYLYYMGASLIKNVVLLPLEIFLFVILYKLVQNFLLNRNLITEKQILK